MWYFILINWLIFEIKFKKMKHLLLIFQPAVFLFVVGACQNSGDSIGQLTDSGMDYEERMDFPLLEKAPGFPDEALESPADSQRMLVKRGNLEFESDQLENDNQKIRKLLPHFKAYVDSENFSNNDYSSTYNLSIKVPVAQFESLMDTLSSVGKRTTNKSSNAEDVTRRYRDLNATIESKKALENRYRELLSKATQIKDMLEIERNLNDLRNEIEGYESRFRTLQGDINYSTINLYFFQLKDQKQAEKPTFFQRLAKSFQGGWDMFIWLLLALVRLWPLGVLAVGTWLIIAYFRKKQQK
jgi:predicted  nucleic acid-binding Zn-ribbon protein